MNYLALHNPLLSKEIKMAQEWLKKYLRMKPEVTTLFDDLEEYKEFCIKQGYVYDEAHLYNEKTPWGEMVRVKNGKHPKDNWSPYPKREWKPKSDWKPRTGGNPNWKR
jgi:hypothetical protein